MNNVLNDYQIVDKLLEQKKSEKHIDILLQ